MKKIIFTFLFVMFFCSAVNAQVFKPSVDVILRGDYSVWLSDSLWKDGFKSFPGVQVEAAVNIVPSFGITGTFSADFIRHKEKTIPGATFTRETSSQLAGYIGPRYYINIPGNRKLKIYIDAAAGLYSFKFGTSKETQTTLPQRITTEYFNSVTQFGFNAGAGINIKLGPAMFANFMVKYHNVLKKTGVMIIEKKTVEEGGTITTTTNLPAVDIDARSYMQFGIGLGFTFGI